MSTAENSIDWEAWSDSDPVPGTWYAVRDADGSDDIDCWTISPDPCRAGWNTDTGCPGYGLPRRVAEELARRLSGGRE